MKMLRRSVCLLLCAALFLALLAGCGKQEEPAEDFAVSAAVCGPLETLDPTMNTDVGAESLLSTLFEGLMRMRDDGAGKAVAVAGIAKEYIEEKNYDDTVTYTFTLRSAARWSDGERVTAEDFVYAWQRLVDPATASPNASLLSMVAGYDEVRESGDVSLLGVKAKGESTFLVTLSRPCAYFITSVCTSPATAPLRRDLVEGNASWAATADIVTNGPYTVGTWVKAAQLQTKRNGEYYESKLVVPDSICFRFETDAQTNYDQLLAGELDYTAKLPYAAIEQLAEDETWQPAPLAETVCVLYNHLTDTFSDAQLRRAFDLAIDRAALAEQLGVGVPTLQDVVQELVKPGRDVRDDLPAPILRTDVLDIKDLKPGMVLTGTVRNVIDFGVFVDIGVHQDGLVHISQVSNKFIKHPSEVVSVGDVVKVVVLEVDEKKKRISLSMKQAK